MAAMDKGKIRETLTAPEAFRELLDIIIRLRSPDGCLWDRMQTKTDGGKYLMEEAYEVLDALENGTPDDIKEELGDLLFQVLFLARISEEEGGFDIVRVLQTVSEKMIRRHPHVFGDKKVKDVDEIRANWEDIKTRVELKGGGEGSLLDRIPRALPALLRAQKITEEAAKVGFDWENADGVFAKMDEELMELKGALAANDRKRVQDELGDMLLTLVNIGRFAGISPEAALRSSLRKFQERFGYMETRLRDRGKVWGGVSLQEMDDLWNEAKNLERRKT